MVSASQDTTAHAAGPGASADTDASADPDAEGWLSPDEVREQLPAYAELALEFVAANRYDYGPKLRDVEMEWTLAGASVAGDPTTRIFIDYRPLQRFRGRSGSEYVDIDAGGAVVARRQVRVPKENLPYVLMGLAAVSIVALIAVQILVWLDPFAGGPELYVSGRTLYLRSELPTSQEHIVFDAAEQSGVENRWAISPEGDGTEMVLIEVTLVNATSGAVRMVIDRDAAELRIADSVGIKPVNVIERSYPVEPEPTRAYVPEFKVMWGSYTINRNEQLTGHLVFEAPVGSEFAELRWLSVDAPRVTFR